MMRIIKLVNHKGTESFAEVIKQGSVQFDSRDDWLLVGIPAGERLCRQEVRWVHPTELEVIWDKTFDLLFK